MRCFVGLLLLLVPAVAVQATEVVDDFESGTNPNGWSWLSGTPGNIIHNGEIRPDGGNPGAWFDSTAPYFSDHPNFTAVPDPGTPLRDALDSGSLHALRINIERLDTSGVDTCGPLNSTPGTFVLQLIDIHSSDALIEAHTSGAATSGNPYPWTTVSFTIPSESTDVPPGWVLSAPPELDYTWADLMQNLDGISVFAVNPDDLTYDACWELGADNVVVQYGDETEAVFANGFEAVP